MIVVSDKYNDKQTRCVRVVCSQRERETWPHATHSKVTSSLAERIRDSSGSLLAALKSFAPTSAPTSLRLSLSVSLSLLAAAAFEIRVLLVLCSLSHLTPPNATHYRYFRASPVLPLPLIDFSPKSDKRRQTTRTPQQVTGDHILPATTHSHPGSWWASGRCPCC